MEYESQDIEYAACIDRYGNLICSCGVSNWKPAIAEEGIGGRALWVIRGGFYSIQKYPDAFGCTGCGRIIESGQPNDIKFPIIAREGDPVS